MLEAAYKAWNDSAALRQRRRRYKHYTYGRQWEDMTTAPNGEVMTEAEHIRLQGCTPLVNNMIRQLVKCVIGRFRASVAECDPASAVEVADEVSARNSLLELDCRMLEEFLISGCAIQRVVTERRMAGDGVWVDNVSPENFFVNKFTDPRGMDIELVGMLHSMSRGEVLMRFGGDAVKRRMIDRIYGTDRSPLSGDVIGVSDRSGFYEASHGRCRVIEVWTLESRAMLRCHDRDKAGYFLAPDTSAAGIERINADRREAGRGLIESVTVSTMRWHCRYYTPTGELLDEFDSPYAHGMHPFAVKFFPLTDGEVHSFVEDVIDQQRHVNRLITLIDHIIGVSAKGVLLFPVDQKPDFLTWQQIGDMWAMSNRIIPYEPRNSNRLPTQVISQGGDAGASQLLSLQLQLFQQISGVSDALQGRVSASGTSAALFDSQLRSSAIALQDLLDSFNSFRTVRNSLIVRSGSVGDQAY